MKYAALNSTAWLLAGATATLLISSCGSGDTSETVKTEPVAQEVRHERSEGAKKIFYSIPSPMEMSSLLMRAGASYDKDLLNELEKRNSYSTVAAKALNLGVYGADLSYAVIFDNVQESRLYLAVTKGLSEDLGITNAFNSETVERLEYNMDNRDSMLQIISSSYANMDDYLQENERGNVSAMIIAGGWIETTYLASKMERELAKTNKNGELKVRLAEQKFSLNDLLHFLDLYKTDPNIAMLLPDLQQLKAVYNDITLTQTAGTTTTDTTRNITTIGGSSSVSISDEHLQKISTILTDLRGKVVSVN